MLAAASCTGSSLPTLTSKKNTLLASCHCWCAATTHKHSWYTYMLLVRMHEVPDLDHKGGIRRLDRYDQLAEYVFGE